ncbi:hypothetical protein [Aureimonas populi]|uniref:Uncharacterized protein n=1 Tax=Aureimonas populi TaxID=1701758 RepID=A0ABW5CKN3_9HYPH|nr:hypothetical protein [Aureimonas populi]
MFVLVALPFGLFLALTFETSQRTPERIPMTVEIGPSSIALERLQAHIFLAEYRRTLVVLRGGEEIGRAGLPMDTGGTAHMNVYRTGEQTLRLVDRLTVYTVNLMDGSVRGTSRTGSGGGSSLTERQGDFIGAFDAIGEGGERVFRFIPSGERPELRIRHARVG